MQMDSSFFKTSVAPGEPSVCVFATAITPRLQFACNFVFNTVLACNYRITTNAGDYSNAATACINYSTLDLPGLRIVPDGLLTETNLRQQKPTAALMDGKPVFFLNQNNESGFGFDAFAAVFYFVSRYEEWQAFKADSHDRFEAAESLLYKNGLHLRPVVDEWIWELGAALEKANPGFKLKKPAFRVLSTIDIDNLFAYKAKGWLRTVGASVRDVVTFKFKNFSARLSVLLGRKNDPFDIYDGVLQFAGEHNTPLAFFFLCRTGTRYDRVASPGSEAYTNVLKKLKDSALIGLHPSYEAAYNKELISRERALLEAMGAKPVTASRQHFLRYDVRQTPQWLIQAGIHLDFTMGFASSPGFRAGTAHPFYSFDLATNTTRELLHVPFCAMDGAYLLYDSKNATEALDSMLQMAQAVKQTGGFFMTVFHESTLSDHLYKGIGDLYKNLHVRLKALTHASN